MAALVDVPLFARSTVDPNSEVSAALVLLRFLVAVPDRRRRRRGPVPEADAGAGRGGLGYGAWRRSSFVAMTSWSATALGGGPRWSDVELVICGLGFGLAIAPVNVAILGAVQPSAHALASALAVVARTIGMLAGLSALTAVGLHRFYQAQARIGSPLTLVPRSSGVVPGLRQRHHQCAGPRAAHHLRRAAAVCAAVAGVLALLLLGGRPLTADVEDTTTSSALPRLLG